MELSHDAALYYNYILILWIFYLDFRSYLDIYLAYYSYGRLNATVNAINIVIITDLDLIKSVLYGRDILYVKRTR